MLSAVGEMLPVEVPPVRVKEMVEPPDVIKLPAASFAVKVRVIVFPEETVGDETVTNEVVVLMAPSVTVTVGAAEVTFEPPTVDVIVVGVPFNTPAKLVVYVPLPLSVTEPKVPVDVPPEYAKATVCPPVVRLLLLESLACNVTPVLVPDAMVALVTVTTV